LKFRRQVPIGDRIVDFFCAEARLAIELDGSGHTRHFTETSDLDRAIELHEKGIRIIRFYNRQIDENLDGVLNAIIYAVDPEKSLWASGADMGPSP
jgi:very-short-patch-repair endonuclease